MADQQQNILLKINIDVDELKQKLVTITQEMQTLKAENKALGVEANAALKDGAIATFNTLSEKIVNNTLRLKELGQEQKNTTNVININSQALKASEGSYEQLLRNYQLAAIELKNMEGTLQKNEDGTFQLTEQYKKQADQVTKSKEAIIAFDQGIKDGRSNVGNYGDAIKKVFDQVTIVTGQLNNIHSSINKLNEDFKTGSVSSQEFKAQSEQLNNELNKTTDQLNSLNDEMTRVKNVSEAVAEGFTSLRQEVKQAKEEATALAQKFGENSKEAIEAAKRVADLSEKMNDFNARVQALNPEAKFKAFVQAAGSIAGAFSAAQGAMALFGQQSEETQQALLKVQSALAIAQGLNAFAELGDSLKNIKIVLGLTTVATEAQTVAQAENVVTTEAGVVATGELAVAETTAAASSGALGTAINIMLGPIGLAVLAIGATVTALTLMSSSASAAAINLDSLSHEHDVYSESLKRNKTISDEEIKTLESKIELRTKEGASITELAQLNDELRSQKIVANTTERNVESEHLRELVRIRAQFSDTAIENLKEDERKKAIEQKTSNEKEIADTKFRIDFLANEEKLTREKLRVEELQTETTALNESNKIRISLIKDQQQREIETIKQTLGLKLNEIKGSSQAENELRASLTLESELQIRDIRRKFIGEEISERNQLEILSSVENTEKRVQAEILSEQRIRNFKLSDESLTESKRQVIIAESEQKIRELQNKEIEIAEERNQKLVELEQRKNTAIINSQKSQSDLNNPVQNLTINLDAINTELNNELELRNTTREKELRANEKFVDDQISVLKNSTSFKTATIQEQNSQINEILLEGQKENTAIVEAANAENLALTEKAAKDIRDAIKASQDQRIQDLIDFEELKKSAAGTGDEQLAATLNILDLQELAEIESYRVRLKDSEDFQKAKVLIENKYAKLRSQASLESDQAQIQSFSTVIGQVGNLVKKGSQEYKAILTAQATIDTYAAAVAAYKSTVAIPIVGPALAPAAAALAIATGFANIARINEVKGFKYGGHTVEKVIERYNPSFIGTFKHGGTIKRPSMGLIGEEGTEYVTPNWMVKHPKVQPIIQNLEAIRSAGYLPFIDGGFTGNQIINQTNSVDTSSAVIDIVKNLGPFIVTVEDINNKQDEVAKTVQVANV